jgi:hypothetical protein
MNNQNLRCYWCLTLPILLSVLVLSSCGPQQNSNTTVQASSGLKPTSLTSETPKANVARASLGSPASEASVSVSSILPHEVRAKPQDGKCSINRPIKGRSSKQAKIYHLPKSPGYSEVKPDECFTTIDEAVKAGYRAPKSSSEYHNVKG